MTMHRCREYLVQGAQNGKNLALEKYLRKIQEIKCERGKETVAMLA